MHVMQNSRINANNKALHGPRKVSVASFYTSTAFMKPNIFSLFIPLAYIETAISACLLAWAQAKLAESENASIYAVFVFFGTLTVYNLLRVVSLFRRVQGGVNWKSVPDLLFVPLHITIVGIAGLTALVLLFFQKLNLSYVLLICLLFFTSLSYRFRWFRLRSKNVALSDLPHLKSILVAGVWMLICSVIPNSFKISEWLTYLTIFLYFFGLSIPFDIRDLERDAPTRRTIPQVFGVAKSKNISLSLILLSHILSTYQMQCSILIFIVSALIHAFLINSVSEKQNKANIYRLLDAAPILLALGMLHYAIN